MSRRVIINADDFALTAGVSTAIIDTIHSGVASSTSVMPCVPGAIERLRQLGGAVQHCLGVHLQLTGGRPCLQTGSIPTLVDRAGAFPRGLGAFHVDLLSAKEVFAEWCAQVEAVLEAGMPVDHIDSHHNVHLHGNLLDVYAAVAMRFSVGARSGSADVTQRLRAIGVRCPDRAVGRWTHECPPEMESLLGVITDEFEAVAPDGCIEVVCHPGRVDDELRQVSTLTDRREAEYQVLSDPRSVQRFQSAGIQCISFGEL